MPPINVTLNVNANSINASLAPLKSHVPNGNQQVTLQWTANGGATFPADAVKWKNPGNPPPPTVTNPPGATTIRSAAYTNNFGNKVVWAYEIGIQDGSVLVTIDPEIVNDPPPTEPPKGEEEPKP